MTAGGTADQSGNDDEILGTTINREEPNVADGAQKEQP